MSGAATGVEAAAGSVNSLSFLDVWCLSQQSNDSRGLAGIGGFAIEPPDEVNLVLDAAATAADVAAMQASGRHYMVSLSPDSSTDLIKQLPASCIVALGRGTTPEMAAAISENVIVRVGGFVPHKTIFALKANTVFVQAGCRAEKVGNLPEAVFRVIFVADSSLFMDGRITALPDTVSSVFVQAANLLAGGGGVEEKIQVALRGSKVKELCVDPYFDPSKADGDLKAAYSATEEPFWVGDLAELRGDLKVEVACDSSLNQSDSGAVAGSDAAGGGAPVVQGPFLGSLGGSGGGSSLEVAL